jgi:hypothetical protein
MATLKLNSYELFTQSENNKPEFGTGVPTGCMLNIESAWFNNQLSYNTADGTGFSSADGSPISSGGFSVVPSLTYVTLTAKQSNSKYYLNFTGNMSTSTEASLGDWIGAFGFLVDTNGGTSWQHVGAGVNGSHPSNVKYFLSRASATGGGNDSYYTMQLAGSFLYTSNVTSGNNIRFAIEYFHYDNSSHEYLYINRTPTNSTGIQPYKGGLATTFTVMEIAA